MNSNEVSFLDKVLKIVKDQSDGVRPLIEFKHPKELEACWGGSLMLSAKYSSKLSGIERADSITRNPHKVAGAPLLCSVFLVLDNGLVHEANSAAAQYLFQQDKFYDVTYDTGDKSVQCGRKVTPKIKELLTLNSQLMVAYSPLRHHKNFFRLAFTFHPKLEEKQVLDMILSIEKCGETIATHIL